MGEVVEASGEAATTSSIRPRWPARSVRSHTRAAWRPSPVEPGDDVVDAPGRRRRRRRAPRQRRTPRRPPGRSPGRAGDDHDGAVQPVRTAPCHRRVLPTSPGERSASAVVASNVSGIGCGTVDVIASDDRRDTEPRRSQMRVVKMEAIPVAYPEPNDFDATRYLCLVKLTADDGTGRLGRVDHPVPRGQRRRRRADRRPRRVRRRRRPGAHRGGLATASRTGRGGTATAAGSPRTPSRRSTSPCGTSRARRSAAASATCSAGRSTSGCRRSPRRTPTSSRSRRWSRRRRAGSRTGCTASRSASASAATPASATSTIATSSTCGRCARASAPTSS